MGPTPPGTGVIEPAISFTSSKSTSPTKRVLLSPFSSISTLLMPTSITTDPGLTQSFFTKLGMPTAATNISASEEISSRFCDLE